MFLFFSYFNCCGNIAFCRHEHCQQKAADVIAVSFFFVPPSGHLYTHFHRCLLATIISCCWLASGVRPCGIRCLDTPCPPFLLSLLAPLHSNGPRLGLDSHDDPFFPSWATSSSLNSVVSCWHQRIRHLLPPFVSVVSSWRSSQSLVSLCPPGQ